MSKKRGPPVTIEEILNWPPDANISTMLAPVREAELAVADARAAVAAAQAHLLLLVAHEARAIQGVRDQIRNLWTPEEINEAESAARKSREPA